MSKNIIFEEKDIFSAGTPISDLPQEIIEHYIENGYGDKGIPFSASTVMEIEKALYDGK